MSVMAVTHQTVRKSLMKQEVPSSNTSETSSVAGDLSSGSLGGSGASLTTLTTTTTQQPRVGQKFDFGKCKVCRDAATGIHYGIPSCEGCKGFYKRSVDKHDKYVCYFGYKCTITPRQRRRCKSCRWKACVAAGMSFDSIKMGRISKVDKERVKKIIETDDTPITVLNSKQIYDRIVHDCTTVARPGFLLDEASLTENLREKCFEAYEEFSRDMVDVYQRAIDCLRLNKPEPLSPDRIDQETIQLIWQNVLNKLSDNTKSIVYFIKSLPGFSQLDVTDLAALFEEHTGQLLGLKVTRSFVGGEVFFMIAYNLRMTRGLVARLMGITIQERIFKFHEKFNSLGVLEREMALLMPAIITHVDDKMTLKNPDQVKALHELYKNALKEEFELQKRTPEFILDLIETLKLSPMRKENHPIKPEERQRELEYRRCLK